MSAAAREWVQHDRDPDYLYRGGRLSQAEEWAQDRSEGLSAEEHAFLNASVELRDVEAERLEAQRQKELESARDLAEERTRSATRSLPAMEVRSTRRVVRGRRRRVRMAAVA